MKKYVLTPFDVYQKQHLQEEQKNEHPPLTPQEEKKGTPLTPQEEKKGTLLLKTTPSPSSHKKLALSEVGDKTPLSEDKGANPKVSSQDKLPLEKERRGGVGETYKSNTISSVTPKVKASTASTAVEEKSSDNSFKKDSGEREIVPQLHDNKAVRTKHTRI